MQARCDDCRNFEALDIHVMRLLILDTWPRAFP